MRAILPFDVQGDCLPLAAPSAPVFACPLPFVHLTPILSEFLPLLILDLPSLPGPAWPHHGCGALHLPDKFPPGWRVGDGGCLARGQRGWGRCTHTCGTTPHIRCDSFHESSMLGSWHRERNTRLSVNSDSRQHCLPPPLLHI